MDPHVGQVTVESRTQRIGNRTGGWKEIRVDHEVDLVGRSRNLVEHDGRVTEMNSHVGSDLPVQHPSKFRPDHKIVVAVRADVAFQSVHASDRRGRDASNSCGLTALNVKPNLLVRHINHFATFEAVGGAEALALAGQLVVADAKVIELVSLLFETFCGGIGVLGR